MESSPSGLGRPERQASGPFPILPTVLVLPTGRARQHRSPRLFPKVGPSPDAENFMQVHVTFRNAEATPALKNYATQKLQRVAKLVVKPEKAQVTLSVEKFRHTAELIVSGNGERFVSTEQSKDMYEAIDLAVDRLESQLRRYKEKFHSHKGDPAMGDLPRSGSADAEPGTF